MKSYGVTIQMKATEQYFPVVLFIMLYKVALTFESVDEILWCYHSNEPPQQYAFTWYYLFTGAPDGSVPQNLCSSGQFLLAGRFGKNSMPLEGKCCWEISNSGGLRGFDV